MNDLKTPIVPERVAKINADIAASPLAAQGISVAPSAITSESLNPVKAVSIPQTPISTTAEGITGATTALAETTKANDALQRAEDAKVAEAQAKTNESKSSLTSLMQKITGVQESRGALEQNAGIDKKTTSYNTALTSLEGSQRAQTNEIRALDSQPGLTTAGKAAAAQAINRKYAFEQADMSLILSVANRDLVSAQSMVDKKIQLALEPLKTQLDFTKLFYDDNKADLNKEEERAFQTKIKELDNSFKLTEAFEKRKGDIQLKLLEAGAPTSTVLAVGKATNDNDLLSATGTSLSKGSTTVPTIKAINGVDMQWNPKTGTWEKPTVTQGGASDSLPLAQAEESINTVNNLLSDKNIRSAVGPIGLARLIGSGYDRATGGRQNFIASVEQLTSQLSLDSLVQAKARGATFGALSEGELRLLSNSATKLSKWANTDDNGKVTGYSASEKDFKAELDKINNFAKLDYILKGGTPENVGAVLMTDGNYYSQNSDGTYSQLTQ